MTVKFGLRPTRILARIANASFTPDHAALTCPPAWLSRSGRILQRIRNSTDSFALVQFNLKCTRPRQMRGRCRDDRLVAGELARAIDRKRIGLAPGLAAGTVKQIIGLDCTIGTPWHAAHFAHHRWRFRVSRGTQDHLVLCAIDGRIGRGIHDQIRRERIERSPNLSGRVRPSTLPSFPIDGNSAPPTCPLVPVRRMRIRLVHSPTEFLTSASRGNARPFRATRASQPSRSRSPGRPTAPRPHLAGCNNRHICRRNRPFSTTPRSRAQSRATLLAQLDGDMSAGGRAVEVDIDRDVQHLSPEHALIQRRLARSFLQIRFLPEFSNKCLHFSRTNVWAMRQVGGHQRKLFLITVEGAARTQTMIDRHAIDYADR